MNGVLVYQLCCPTVPEEGGGAHCGSCDLPQGGFGCLNENFECVSPLASTPRQRQRPRREGEGAEVGQEVEQEAQSGPVDLSSEVTNSGHFAHQCAAVLQFANTGNFQNAPSVLQFGSDLGSVEVGGITISVTPELITRCQRMLGQSSAASG